jgi:hypothetical protein
MAEINLEEAIDALVASYDLKNEEFVRRAKEKISNLPEDEKGKLLQVTGALHYHAKIA